MAAVALCFDGEVARVLLDEGVAVVLFGADAALLGRTAASLRAAGRVSVMIGDPDDETDRAAALAMAGELHGDAVLVRTVAEARELLGR